MTEKSRQFEQLVARIEHALAPIGAVVTSPDHLRDIFTGGDREVDASIRARVGSVDVLITVECRDRAKTEDVTWIEQLATKQKHVGAALTIAVSSSAFSSPALDAARLHGIRTRTIEDISDEEIVAWPEELEISEDEIDVTLHSLQLGFHDAGEPPPALDSDSVEKWTNEGFLAKIFIDKTSGEVLTLAGAVARSLPPEVRPVSLGGLQLVIPPKGKVVIGTNPLTSLLRDVPADGSEVRQTYWLDFEVGRLAVVTVRGTQDVSRMGLEVTASKSTRKVPVARTIRYSERGQQIVEAAEHELALGEGILYVTQHRGRDEKGNR